MEKEHIKPKYKTEILRALEYHFPEKKKVYLFGSRARLTHKEGADVDIAIDTGKKLDAREVMRALVTLENLFIPLNIDLLDFHAIPKELQQIILGEGVLWKNY